MQNGNRQVTVLDVCALSLWERDGVRASGRRVLLSPFYFHSSHLSRFFSFPLLR